MSILSIVPITVNVTGTELEVSRIFLQVFLGQQRLTGRELDVTAVLISRYAKLLNDGVNEPYTSTILFSTDVRREMSKQLGISSAHLQNTFGTLQSKNIIKSDQLLLNPALIPTSKLTFNFSVNG